jgi:hypothetical protein
MGTSQKNALYSKGIPYYFNKSVAYVKDYILEKRFIFLID